MPQDYDGYDWLDLSRRFTRRYKIFLSQRKNGDLANTRRKLYSNFRRFETPEIVVDLRK